MTLASTLGARRPGSGRPAVGIALALLPLAAFAAATLLAPPALPLERWAELLSAPGGGTAPELVFWHVRVPRAALAVLVGAGLAVGGLLMQTLSGNPLATPSILGVTNGAALGLVLAVAAVPGLSEGTATLASFAGAALSALVIALVGLTPGRVLTGDGLVIAGSILGAFTGSVVTAIVFFDSLQNELLGWTLGRLVHVDWAQVRLAAPAVGLGLVAALAVVDRLELLRLGETTARELGVPVGAVRAGVVLAIVLLTGGSVAAAGPVAYVGLIVPHLLRRRALGPRARLLACAAVGACLTAGADLLAQATSDERVVPLGIWTMALGSLLFFSLSLRRDGRFDG